MTTAETKGPLPEADRPGVHQLLVSLSPGDAIGNEALVIQRHLRRAGYSSEVFAEQIHPRMARHARPLWEYSQVSSAETTCLFHFSISGAASRLIYHAPDRLVLIYHNITPAASFLGFHSHLTALCHWGRHELKAFATRVELALGDSEFNRLELEKAGYSRTGVLPIVLDLDAYSRAPSRVIPKFYNDGRTNILFVGRIIPSKKVDDLIRAFAIYQRFKNPRSRLLVVGDYQGHERYYDCLQAMIRELRVEEVVFAGHVEQDDLLAYYSLAHLFLCLSEHEGYCVPLVEAMALGIPVLAFDAGAVAETLGGGGVLLKEKAPELVAELIFSLLTEEGLRKSVLATQHRVARKVRETDFGALLIDRLRPVLGGRP